MFEYRNFVITSYSIHYTKLYDLRAQVNAERIKISAKDDVKPFVTKTTPEYGADVAVSGFAVVLNFSEP